MARGTCALNGCESGEYASGFCQVHYKWLRKAGGLSDEDRFWSYVKKADGCWLWSGPFNKNGYGHLHFGGGKQVASRIAWQIANGRPIPPHSVVLHSCDTPACVNPAHLRVGTQADNIKDMHDKGRARKRGMKGEEHIKSKLTTEDVACIKASTEKGVILAQQYGVTPALISNIRQGRTWTHVVVKVKPKTRSRTVLTADQVREIRTAAEPGYILAARFGISPQTICDIQKGRSWKHIT